MFGSIKAYLYIGLAAVFMLLAMQGLSFINESMDNAATVILQGAQLEIKDAHITSLETEKAQAEEAMRIAEEERVALEERNTELRGIRDSALQAGDEADGIIAPVLGDTLRALSP